MKIKIIKPKDSESFCSEAEITVLNGLSTEDWSSAAWIAGKVWASLPGPVSKSSGQWQRMGAMLHKLYDRGFVHRKTTRYNQNLWRRSSKDAILKP